MSRQTAFLFIAIALFVIIGASRAIPDRHLFFPVIIGDGTHGSLSITNVSDNRLDYTGKQIPKYEKLEITFQVLNSVAQNLQLPFDPNPPFGIDPAKYTKHKGVSVDAYFLPPGETNWDNAFAQPGFIYQPYDYSVKDGSDWFYPKNRLVWKVRFSPHQLGNWQYKIKV